MNAFFAYTMQTVLVRCKCFMKPAPERCVLLGCGLFRRYCKRTNAVFSFHPCETLKACAQRFGYALFAFIHTQTYFEYYTLTLRLARVVKKAVIYAYWTKELFDICREPVSHMATLPSVARHVIHADNLHPRH